MSSHIVSLFSDNMNFVRHKDIDMQIQANQLTKIVISDADNQILVLFVLDTASLLQLIFTKLVKNFTFNSSSSSTM